MLPPFAEKTLFKKCWPDWKASSKAAKASTWPAAPPTMAASMQGAALAGMSPTPARRERKRYTLSDLQRKRVSPLFR